VLVFMHFDFQIVNILLVKQFQILSLEHVMVDWDVNERKKIAQRKRVEYRYFGDDCIQSACKSAQNQPRIAHLSFYGKPSFKGESLPLVPHWKTGFDWWSERGTRSILSVGFAKTGRR